MNLDLSRPQVMGVLNLTPDSFSDGGLWTDPEIACVHAREMVAAGAAFIDLGGESTRPGAHAVGVDEEIRRVVPVIERLAGTVPALISIDTSKPEVMYAAVGVGAGLINDVWALRQPGAMEAAAALGVPVCLMHMQGEPGTMQASPDYVDVVSEVEAFLLSRAKSCLAAGIPREHILLDPGFGFGKTLAHNLQLMRQIGRLAGHGYPLLVGVSRKAMIGALTGMPLEKRLAGSVAAAVIAAAEGASVLRVHDVAETVQALAVLTAIREQG